MSESETEGDIEQTGRQSIYLKAEQKKKKRVKEGLSVAALGKLPPHLLVHVVCAAAVSCHFGPQSSGAEVLSGSLPPFVPRKLACLSTALKWSSFPLLQPSCHFFP